MTDQDADRVQAGVDGADIAVKELQKVQQANGKLIQLVTEELLLVEKVAAGEKLDALGSPTKKIKFILTATQIADQPWPALKPN